MSDRIREELERLQSRRDIMWDDLKKHSLTMSAHSQVVIIAEIAKIDIEIKQITRELEIMEFEDMMRNAWKEGEAS